MTGVGHSTRLLFHEVTKDTKHTNNTNGFVLLRELRVFAINSRQI